MLLVGGEEGRPEERQEGFGVLGSNGSGGGGVLEKVAGGECWGALVYRKWVGKLVFFCFGRPI